MRPVLIKFCPVFCAVQATRQDLLHQRGIRGEVGAGHQGVRQVQEAGQPLRFQVRDSVILEPYFKDFILSFCL